MLPRIQPGLQPAAAHTCTDYGRRYRCGYSNTGRDPYSDAQPDSTSRQYADGCGCNSSHRAARVRSSAESHAITDAGPVTDTCPNSCVDAPPVTDTVTDGYAESHGYASPYSDADSATHADGYPDSNCTTNPNTDTGPDAYAHSYPA